MGDLTIQQRRQAIAAGDAIKKAVGRESCIGGLGRRPFRKLGEGALPNDLFLLIFDAAQPVLEQRISIGAPEQRATARAFPFSKFLLQFPWLELRAAPAEILRSDAAQGGEG